MLISATKPFPVAKCCEAGSSARAHLQHSAQRRSFSETFGGQGWSSTEAPLFGKGLLPLGSRGMVPGLT